MPAGPPPLIVWIHGGGWVAGDKREGGTPGSAGYTKRGYAVASINYRLSGDAIFPAQIEDCKAALRWLRAHTKEYNLDAAHIGVWGSSAGGVSKFRPWAKLIGPIFHGATAISPWFARQGLFWLHLTTGLGGGLLACTGFALSRRRFFGRKSREPVAEPLVLG